MVRRGAVRKRCVTVSLRQCHKSICRTKPLKSFSQVTCQRGRRHGRGCEPEHGGGPVARSKNCASIVAATIIATSFVRHLPMTPPSSPVRIASQPHQPNLSKGQKTFNTLVKRIESSRETLVQWQVVLVTYQQKVATDYVPLAQTFRELQGTMVHSLDLALDRKGLTQAERLVVQDIICRLAEHLIVDTGDEALKEIYNKYSDLDFDAEEAAAVSSMKSAVEAMFEIDLDDAAELDSTEDVMAQVLAQMEKEHLLRIEEEDQRSQRKKTAKQLARETKLKAEAEQTSLSIREVYRKLVSALHPDRERDPEERTRKTALMQRVNQAYDKKDLLQLLELQLELEHIDANAIAGLSEDRLKHFNKILKDQLAELEMEIAHLVIPLHQQFNLSPNQTLLPNAVLPHLIRDIAELRRRIKDIQREILVPNDLTAFKAWIKDRRREIREREARMRDEDDFPIF